MSIETLHFHIFGPPGVGKSVLAAQVYAELKVRGVDVELVQEYAKELLREGRLDPQYQALTTAEQIRREERLRGQVEVIVTDSPPLLGVAYALAPHKQVLLQTVLGITEQWRCVSVLLLRDVLVSYQQSGRQQTPSESMQKAVEIEGIMRDASVEYTRITMGNDPRVIRPLAEQLCDELQRVLRPRDERTPLASARRPLREIHIPPLDLTA